ncbi:hypothetical protein SO802_031865 [Lithocarpus litseifolius]|uniref:Uncharacterized protein n=1 Tax=Lithocarpus litseifolius TaxID=425828 RepID=A0AAW2BQ42_9ROSI
MRRVEDPNAQRDREQERQREILTMATLKRTPTESHQQLYHQIERYEDGERQSIRHAGRLRKGFERQDRLEQLCLNAPTPIRYLNPRERAREAQREKLGPISKERQRELDILKKQNSKKASKKDKEVFQEIIGTPGLDLISLGIVDADLVPKYELTAEDGKQLAKEYSRVLMRRHRARQAAESTLLRLKKEAIEALPEELRAAALVPDLTPFPANRFMATLTPPIEGYIDKVRLSLQIKTKFG